MKAKSSPSRRDFLKLTGLVPLGLAMPPFVRLVAPSQAAPQGRKNVLVVVFDAFSAYNISLYGYTRETTPNLARLAKQAIVYHNHYAPANFTSPGTASLLTSAYPWTHRAMEFGSRVEKPWGGRSFFSVFHDYHRLAYTHNDWAYILLQQLNFGMEELLPLEKLFLHPNAAVVERLFNNDHDIASVSWARDMNLDEGGYAYSLFMSHLYSVLNSYSTQDLKRFYPRGLPQPERNPSRSYLLEQAIDWLQQRLPQVPTPYFAYFHMLPPHADYRTSVEFYNRFLHDGYRPPRKPRDEWPATPFPNVRRSRREYDEFILYVDREFGRLFAALEASGILENTWVILTSDHGEMFERGLVGHGHRSLYEPVIRIPLLIFEPGRPAGMEIHALTSSLDVLPTLAHVTGHAVPRWTEGVVLPPYSGDSPDPDRSIYALQAPETHSYRPLKEAATMLVKGPYKLHYYFGYEDLGDKPELVKLYNIQADPEELVDLSSSQPATAAELLHELKAKLAEVNQPYL